MIIVDLIRDDLCAKARAARSSAKVDFPAEGCPVKISDGIASQGSYIDLEVSKEGVGRVQQKSI